MQKHSFSWVEIQQLETSLRMEPRLSPHEGESMALTSIAISLKRYVDIVDRKTAKERLDDAEVMLVNTLCDRLKRNGKFIDGSWGDVLTAVLDHLGVKS